MKALLTIALLLFVCKLGPAETIEPTFTPPNIEELTKDQTVQVWKLTHDLKLDGALADAMPAQYWKVTAEKKRLTATALLPHEHLADHAMSGEWIDGKTFIVNLRQDSRKGYSSLMIGKQVEEGHVVGTWFDNQGRSGDFTFSIIKN